MTRKKKKLVAIIIISISIFVVAACIITPTNKATNPVATSEEKSIVQVTTDNNTETNLTKKIPQKTVVPIAKNLSTWLWESPDTFTEAQLNKMFAIAETEKITTIYVRMDDYVDLYSIKDSKIKKQKINALDSAAKQFITTATMYNINVQALGGDTDWSEPEQRDYAISVFDAVINYNKANPSARFVGIQYDVEANNDPAYKINKIAVLNNYLDFASIMVSKSKENNNFTLGFTIPFWYDNENNNGVIVEWGGKGFKPVGYHLFDILNNTNGYAVLMDYRNYATGTDGSIANAEKELNYVKTNKLKTIIIIGQETTDVLPRKITFFDKSKQLFKVEIAKIVAAFAQNLNFGGIAIHHLQSYIDL